MVVGRSPQLRDRSDAGAFVVFGEPLPVGTALVLKIDDKDQHARVTEVVESADTSAAGMRVRFVSAAEKSGPVRVAAPQPAPAAAVPVPAAVQPAAEAGSAPVPVPVGAAESTGATGSTGVPAPGDASAQHATDSHGHHDGEHGRRKRRRK